MPNISLIYSPLFFVIMQVITIKVIIHSTLIKTKGFNMYSITVYLRLFRVIPKFLQIGNLTLEIFHDH